MDQLKEIIEGEKKTDQSAREVQKQLDGKEDLDPVDTSSVLNTVLITINNEYQHQCFEEVITLAECSSYSSIN
jgi:hypothetical protein